MAENTTVSRLMLGNTTEQLATLHGKDKQVVVDTTKHTAVVMDGVTPGGHPLAREEIKIKSGSPGLQINGGEEATLAGDVTITSTGSGATKLYDGVIDFDNTEQVVEAASGVPLGGIVAYDCCPDCSTSEDVVVGGAFNTREFITESGEWEAPVTGIYRVTCIGGGQSGWYSQYGGYHNFLASHSGAYVERTVFLAKGQKVPVEIGAGGVAVKKNDTDWGPDEGGETSFGSLTTAGDGRYLFGNKMTVPLSQAGNNDGGGFGGAHWWTDARWYGASGSAAAQGNGDNLTVTSGYQGCVILEYYDASKDKNISVDMAASVTLAELQSQIAALTARVQELENE